MSRSVLSQDPTGPESRVGVRRLVERYRDTVLHIAGRLVVDLRVPPTPRILDGIARYAPTPPFAVITAFNPGGPRPDGENLHRHEELVGRIEESSAAWVSAAGCSPDRSHCEEGVAVALPKPEAITIAREFGQDAIFWFDGNTFFLVGACVSFGPVRLPPPEPNLQ